MNHPMRLILALAVAITIDSASPLFSEIIVFVDGTEIDVAAYEIKGKLVVFTTVEGRVRSVPLTLLDVHATAQRKNGRGSSEAQLTRQSVSPSSRKPTPLIDPSTKNARELLESSGMKPLVLQMSYHVPWDLAEADRLIPGYRRELEAVQSAFEPAFQSERIYEVVTASLTESAGDPRLQRTLAWFRSPLSRRMSRLTLATQAPEHHQLLRGYADQLAANMPPARRLELLQRLDEATGLTKFEVERRLSIFRAFMEAVNRSVPTERRIPQQAIDEAIQGARARLGASTQNSSLVKLLYTYQPASDPELARYVAFWETEDGRWLNQVLRNSLFSGLAWGLEIAARATAEKTGIRSRKAPVF